MNEVFARLKAAHHWLLFLPPSLGWVAVSVGALNLASNLGNSFATLPHFGGPLVAWATFLAYITCFAAALMAVGAKRAVGLQGVVGLKAHAQQYKGRLRGLGCQNLGRVGGLRIRQRGPSGPRSPGPRPFSGPPLRYLIVLWALWTGWQALGVLVVSVPRDLASPAHYGSDEMYYAQFNAGLVLHGQNPYQGDQLAPALRAFHTTSITLLRRPPFDDPLHPPTHAQTQDLVAAYLANPAAPHPQIAPETTHSYPALSFLMAVPSVAVGLPTLGYLQMGALLLGMVALVWLAPTQWRVAIAALCLLDVDGIRSVAASDFAIWTAVGVGVTWWLGERAWLRSAGAGAKNKSLIWAAVALGLACAVQQTVWFFAPFWLIHIWQRQGWQAAARAALVAGGAFLAINLPWILATPGSWLHSLVLPLALPLFPTGGGLVGLGLGGAMPLWPPLAYSVLEGLAYGVLLAWYGWRGRELPLAGLILPLAALLLAWRSPSRYFILLPYLVILAWLITPPQPSMPNESPDPAAPAVR